MAQNSFWSDASRGGAIVGLTGVVFSLLGMAVPSIGFIANLANFVVTIYLLFYFTRRRSMLHAAEEGFTYSQSLGFIVAMAIFAGIIAGAYQIVASNFLFKEMFRYLLQVGIKSNTEEGLLPADVCY